MPQIAHIVEGDGGGPNGRRLGGEHGADVAGDGLGRGPWRRVDEVAFEQASSECAESQDGGGIPVAGLGAAFGVGPELRGRTVVVRAQQVGTGPSHRPRRARTAPDDECHHESGHDEDAHDDECAGSDARGVAAVEEIGDEPRNVTGEEVEPGRLRVGIARL